MNTLIKTNSIIKLVLPMLASRFIQLLTSFIGILMLAHYNETVFAASALITISFSPIYIITSSVLLSVSVIVSKLHSETNYLELGKLALQGMGLCFVLSIIMGLLFWYIGDILKLLGEPTYLTVIVSQYFRSLIWGVPAILLSFFMQQFFYGINRQNTVIVANIIFLIIFILLAYGMIYGKMYFPALGITGLAYAFDIGIWINLLILIVFMFFSKTKIITLKFSLSSHYLKKMIHIGLPISMQSSGEMIAFFIYGIFVGWLGDKALAASQIIQQWLALLIIPLFSMSEATAILVSRSVGEKTYFNVMVVAKKCLYVTLLFVVVISVVMTFFPGYFVALYFNKSTMQTNGIVYTAVWLFRILAFTLIIEAIRVVIVGALRGLGNTFYPMVLILAVTYIIALPLRYFAAFYLQTGIIGMSFAGLVGSFVTALLICWYGYKYLLNLIPLQSRVNTSLNN